MCLVFVAHIEHLVHVMHCVQAYNFCVLAHDTYSYCVQAHNTYSYCAQAHNTYSYCAQAHNKYSYCAQAHKGGGLADRSSFQQTLIGQKGLGHHPMHQGLRLNFETKSGPKSHHLNTLLGTAEDYGQAMMSCPQHWALAV